MYICACTHTFDVLIEFISFRVTIIGYEIIINDDGNLVWRERVDPVVTKCLKTLEMTKMMQTEARKKFIEGSNAIQMYVIKFECICCLFKFMQIHLNSFKFIQI
jgi:hypothetical protein